MTWFSLLTTVLKLASALASIVREKQLMDAGEERALAKSLTEIAARAGVNLRIEEESAKMTAPAIVEDMAKHGELRD